MQVLMFGGTVNSSVVQVFRNAPYSVLVSEATLTVGAAALVAVYVAIATQNFQIFLRNSSTAAQNVRWGTTPAFSTAGFLLAAGEAVVIEAHQVSINVIADAAGALVDAVVYRSNA